MSIYAVTADELREKADQAVEQDEYDMAIEYHNQAIELEPDNAEAYYLRGIFNLENIDDELAVNDFNKAIELGFSKIDIYYYRGLANEGFVEYEDAIDDLTIFLNSNSEKSELMLVNAYESRGWCNYDLGNLAVALEDYLQVIEIDPLKYGSHNIIASIYLNNEQFEELDDEFMESQLKRIEEQVMYMSETVNDFRNCFNPDYVINFNVAESIDKSINLVSYITDKNRINLISELDDKCYLNGNPNDLSQVLINVLNNAMDAIAHNEVNDPYIKVVLSCDAEFITIKVFNNGKHIEPENLEKIFESYYTTKGKEGTGIGLSICRKIIENKFCGHIIARNLDKGVEFEITMPNS